MGPMQSKSWKATDWLNLAKWDFKNVSAEKEKWPTPVSGAVSVGVWARISAACGSQILETLSKRAGLLFEDYFILYFILVPIRGLRAF